MHVWLTTCSISIHMKHTIIIFKPQCMCEGYGSRVCVCVCVCIILLAVTYLDYISKVRRHTVSCGLLKICIVWTLLKTFHSGDMALFACHNDR